MKPTYREDDIVKILRGSGSGRIGRVVGFDLLSERSVVVQFQVGESGRYSRVATSPKDLLAVNEAEREPLPPIPLYLQEEEYSPGYTPCGQMLTLTLKSGGCVTFVPKGGDDLKEAYDRGFRVSPKKALENVFRCSFQTRLPHLVMLEQGALIEKLLGSDSKPHKVADELVSSF